MDREAQMLSLLPLIERQAGLFRRKCWLVPIEDLVQIACLAVWKHLDKYDPTQGVPLETWIFARVRGSMTDYVRTHTKLLASGPRNRPHEKVKPLERRFYDSNKDTGYEDRQTSRDHRQRECDEELHDLLRGLSKRERLIVLLMYHEGMNQEQIGESLGIVPSRISQMLPRIRAEIAGRRLRDERRSQDRGKPRSPFLSCAPAAP